MGENIYNFIRCIMLAGNRFHIRLYELIIELFWKFSTFNSYTDDPIRSQICTCHDSWAVVNDGWAVVTYAKLSPDLFMIFHKKYIWIMNIYTLCEICLGIKVALCPTIINFAQLTNLPKLLEPEKIKMKYYEKCNSMACVWKQIRSLPTSNNYIMAHLLPLAAAFQRH